MERENPRNAEDSGQADEEENQRTATHWGTPPDPEVVQETTERSD